MSIEFRCVCMCVCFCVSKQKINLPNENWIELLNGKEQRQIKPYNQNVNIQIAVLALRLVLLKNYANNF